MPEISRASRWSDLRRRVISASLLAPIVLACIWFGSAPFVVLLMLGAIGLTVEWASLCRLTADKWPGLLLPVLVIASGSCAAFGYALPALCVVLAGGAMMWWAVRRPLFASGLLYVGLALVALLWLRGWSAADGRRMVFFVVLVVWASDIGAYVAGRVLRGPKLAPSLSPAKTWSGAVGGLVAAVAVGGLVAGHWSPAIALFAALLAIVCQAGDLLESGIKRHVGVKDSGHLIPGHGGLLDRLDGLLAAAPVAAIVVLTTREIFF